LIIIASLTREQVVSWGWRIPFIASVVFCVFGWFLRRGIRETDEGQQAAAAVRPPILSSLVRDRLPILRTFGIVAMTNAGYYLPFRFAAERRASRGGGAVFWAANLLALAVVLISKPIGGWLSDRIGRRRLMIALTVVGMVATFVALPVLLNGSPW